MMKKYYIVGFLVFLSCLLIVSIFHFKYKNTRLEVDQRFLEAIYKKDLPELNNLVKKYSVPTGLLKFCFFLSSHGRMDAAKLLLNAGVDVNEREEGKLPALYYAAMEDEDGLKLLFENNANPNLVDKNGNTVLHSFDFHVRDAESINSLTDLFLVHGFNACIKNNKGQTVADVAEQQKAFEMAAKLRQSCTDQQAAKTTPPAQ